MEKVKNIYQRINLVMQEVKYIQKEDKKVNNMYRFVAHDAVVGKLHDSFVKHGIVVIPTCDKMTQDGNRTTVDMSISFVNIDDPNDKFDVKYSGFGIDGGDKGPGKAISYAFKYALLKVFCLETGEQDPEYDANSTYEPQSETLSKQQYEELVQLLSKDAEYKKTLTEYLNKKGIDDLKKMPQNMYQSVLVRIQERLKSVAVVGV